MIDIYFDGGCKPNPGLMEVGVVVVLDGKNEPVHERLDYGTNNQAEWLALIMGMMLAETRGYREINLIGDSQLVINQAKGVWQCRKAELQPFLADFRERKASFKRVGLTHVRREHNLAGHMIEEVNR